MKEEDEGVAVIVVEVEPFDPLDDDRDVPDDPDVLDDQVEVTNSEALVKEVVVVDASSFLLDPLDDLVMEYTDFLLLRDFLKNQKWEYLVEDRRQVEPDHLRIFSEYSVLSSSGIPAETVLSFSVVTPLSQVIGECISVFEGDSWRWRELETWVSLQVLLQTMC